MLKEGIKYSDAYVSSLEGHKDSVLTLSIVENQPFLLASISEDNTLKLWDLRTKNIISTICFGIDSSYKKNNSLSLSNCSNIISLDNSLLYCIDENLFSFNFKASKNSFESKLSDSPVNSLYYLPKLHLIGYCTDKFANERRWRYIFF